MATMSFKGLDEYISKLTRLTNNADVPIKKALYKGAGIVADTLKSATNGVPVDNEYANKGEMRNGVSSEDKETLVTGLGIARFRNENGSVTTRVGFRRGAAGVARKVESGTSYMQKHPFIRGAVRRAKAQAESEMAKVFEEETNKLMN